MRVGQQGQELTLGARARPRRQRGPYGNRELSPSGPRERTEEIYPPNVGKLVMPGSKVEFDIHYHAVGEEITDELETAWWFYPEDYTPKFSSEWMAIGGRSASCESIPFAETHVMEHGLYILEGKAVYRLNQDWVEVEAGDFMWLRAFCPQACYAGGPGRFRYLLYKDVNRHARLSTFR